MRSKVLNSLKTDYAANLRSEVFDQHRDRVNEENRTSVIVLLVFTFVIIAANLIILPLMGRSVFNTLIECAIYVVLAGISVLFLRRDNANYTVLAYALELPLLLIALVSGTVFQTDSPSFTFLFFLLVLPSIILDKPRRILGFIWGLGIAFGMLCVVYKPEAIASRDMVHLLNVCLISSALCLCLLSARIRNVNYAADFKEQTFRDPLTGLYNHAGAERRADGREPGALLFIDLDNFKQVNDTFGHAEGDRVLLDVAEVLRRNFRETDVLARMGGDEFAVFARGMWDDKLLGERLQRLLDQLQGVQASDGTDTVAISASIGCVVETHGCSNFSELLRVADKEMYRVKARGKGGYLIVHMD